MNRSGATIAFLSATAILTLLAAPAAMAKSKRVSGSNCSSDWVNNESAMQCFIKGEEEARKGVKHPHYVACGGGDIFCCTNNDRGDVDCEALAIGRPPSRADLIRAILAAQKNRRATSR